MEGGPASASQISTVMQMARAGVAPQSWKMSKHPRLWSRTQRGPWIRDCMQREVGERMAGEINHDIDERELRSQR